MLRLILPGGLILSFFFIIYFQEVLGRARQKNEVGVWCGMLFIFVRLINI